MAKEDFADQLRALRGHDWDTLDAELTYAVVEDGEAVVVVTLASHGLVIESEMAATCILPDAELELDT